MILLAFFISKIRRKKYNPPSRLTRRSLGLRYGVIDSHIMKGSLVYHRTNYVHRNRSWAP